MLWGDACEIHAIGVMHGNLNLRNKVLSQSWKVHIVDFACSEVGHECKEGKALQTSKAFEACVRPTSSPFFWTSSDRVEISESPSEQASEDLPLVVVLSATTANGLLRNGLAPPKVIFGFYGFY